MRSEGEGRIEKRVHGGENTAIRRRLQQEIVSDLKALIEEVTQLLVESSCVDAVG